MLNEREQCVVCPDTRGDLEFDPVYQRLKDRTTMVDPDEVPEAAENYILDGNRIVDVANLSSFLTNKTACRWCATRAAVQLSRTT